MSGQGKTLTIIPAYNEETNIAYVLEGIKSFLPGSDILVVNDASLDNTAEVCRKYDILVINLASHLGYGAALETGYKYAYENKYEYILQIDADGQHKPEGAAGLLDEIVNDRSDIVIGSRYLKDTKYRASLLKKIGGFLFAIITSYIIKQKITDPTSGLQAFNRKVLKFFISGDYPDDYPDADMLIALYQNRFRIKELPVTMNESKRKSMHSGLKPIYYVFKMCLSIFLITIKTKKLED